MTLRLALLPLLWSLTSGLSSAQTDTVAERGRRDSAVETERRIIQYVGENLTPGEPLLLSHLYNEVFTEPEERAVLDRLNAAFFRMPLFLVDYQAQQGDLPTLEEIAGQFDFYGPEEADVVLSVMESDPRVPNFFRRHPESGELLELDVDAIRDDPRFNSALNRSLDWEGKPVPDVGGTSFAGTELRLRDMKEQVVLLYVWFTNCPPCVRIAPELAELHEAYAGRSFTVLGANADRVLGLSYDDAERAAYLERHSIDFPNFHLTEGDREALGNVNIFPTLFLVGTDRNIVKYYLNYQPRDVLEADIEAVLDAGASRSD